MAEMLSPLATRLAAELAANISQVREPYRSNLLAWIGKQIGREIVDLQPDIVAWLNEPEVLMMDQYTLVRIVCQQAERYFSNAIQDETR